MATKKKTPIKKRITPKSTATKKSNTGVATTEKQNGERVVKVPDYKWYYIGKRIKPPLQSIPSSPRIFVRSLKMIQNNWLLFFWITAIYAVINLILVRGFSNVDLQSVKNSFFVAHPQTYTTLGAAFNSFFYLLGNGSSSTSPTAGVFQGIIIIIFTLILIGVLRELYGENKVSVKEAFYNHTGALIQTIIILVIMTVQLIPAIVGIYIFTAVVQGGIATALWEKSIFTVIAALFVFWSLRMFIASLFAFIIATLPSVTPMKAIYSAKDLVHYRRIRIFVKLLFITVAVLVLTGIIVLPFILWVPVIAGWVYFALTIVGYIITVSYLYNLYRSLI